MKHRLSRTIPLLFVSIMGIFLILGSFRSAGQSRSPQKDNANRPFPAGSKHSGPLPVAELGVASTEASAERARRQGREGRYKNSYPFIVDPGKLVDGAQETTKLRIVDWVGELKPFPASTSAAVIVGTIMNSKAFVSEDRTNVYSDFQIRVDEILKQNATVGLVVGGLEVATRAGGTVRFPSGHIKHYIVSGNGIPKVGSQYVLFLWKRFPELSEYEIYMGAAYELREGRAYPLDDYHPELEGIETTTLLAKVKAAIAESPN